jgi:ATP-dependent DNA helicase RecG
MPLTDYSGLSEFTVNLLLGRESTDCEFKKSPGEIDSEYFVAFANASGGVILAGISDDKRVVGCTKSDDEIRQSLLGKADSCRPSIIPLTQIEKEETTDGKRVYRITILKGDDKPYCTQSGLYKIRADGQNRAIFPDEMKRIVIQNSRLPKKIDQLERELQKTKYDTEQLSKTIPTEDQITAMLLNKIRGF